MKQIYLLTILLVFASCKNTCEYTDESNYDSYSYSQSDSYINTYDEPVEPVESEYEDDYYNSAGRAGVTTSGKLGVGLGGGVYLSTDGELELGFGF